MRRNVTHTGRVNGNQLEVAKSPQLQNLRRTSSTTHSNDHGSVHRGSKTDSRDQWKNLGPSNPASRPKQTRYNTVKIKPGGGTLADNVGKPPSETPRTQSVAAQGGVGAGLVSSAGKDAKDGVLAVQAGYGSVHSASPPSPKKSRKGSLVPQHSTEDRDDVRSTNKRRSRATSQDTIGSMNSDIKSPPLKNRGTARSGSITEQIVDAGGIKKTVLEMTSSSDDPEDGGAQVDGSGERPPSRDAAGAKENVKPGEGGGKKKRRRKRRTGRSGGDTEDTPLLGDSH